MMQRSICSPLLQSIGASVSCDSVLDKSEVFVACTICIEKQCSTYAIVLLRMTADHSGRVCNVAAF